MMGITKLFSQQKSMVEDSVFSVRCPDAMDDRAPVLLVTEEKHFGMTSSLPDCVFSAIQIASVPGSSTTDFQPPPK